MVVTFGCRVAEGFLSPRRSAERLLAANPEPRNVLELALLAFAIQIVLRAVTYLVLGSEDGIDAVPPGGGFAVDTTGTVFRDFGQHVAVVAIATGLSFWIGRLLGGTGRFWPVASVVCWHFVIQSILTPVYLIAAIESVSETGSRFGVMLLLLVLSVYLIWILASFLVAAHHFRSVVRVALGIFGVGFLSVLLIVWFGSALLPV